MSVAPTLTLPSVSTDHDDGERVPVWAWAPILVVVLAASLGAFVLGYRYFQVLNCEDLRHATQLSFSYSVRNQPRKVVVIDDPAEVADIIDSMKINNAQMNYFFQQTSAHGLDFMVDGKNVHCQFITKTCIGRDNWGQFHVSEAFYQKLVGIASRQEGRPIDFFNPAN